MSNKEKNYFENIIETNEWLSDRFFSFVANLSGDDFNALLHAVHLRLNSSNPELSSKDIVTLKKTREEISNNLSLTDEKKVWWVKQIDKKLGIID